MEVGNTGFIAAIIVAVLLLLVQQSILTQQQAVYLGVLGCVIWLVFNKDELAKILQKKNVLYTFPDVLQEYARIRDHLTKSHQLPFVMGELKYVQGEPEFGVTANQPSIIHYIADYYDLRTKYKLRKFVRVSQSVIHKKRSDLGIVSIVPNYVPIENKDYSFSGAKKYPTDRGEKFYTVKPRNVTPYEEEPEEKTDEAAEELPDENEEIES